MNKDNAHLFKPFVDALIAGKDVTFLGCTHTNLAFDGDPEDYAIVEPPTPVPLTYEDMEPGCHLRFPDNPDVYAITRFWRTGVKTGDKTLFVYAEIMHAEIYRPSTMTWSPAHK